MRGLSKITRKGRALFLAMDHGMEHGPTDFNEKTINPDYVLDVAKKAKVTAIILQKGVALQYWKNRYNDSPLILKLNGKTSIPSREGPLSGQVCSVDYARKIGASAVGYTVYVGSPYESLMFQEFGRIEEEAHSYGMPVVAWMYPRGRYVGKKKEKSLEMVAYAARVGMELGADIVKVNYTGSMKTFEWVVKSAGKTRVVCSGGSKLPPEKFLKQVTEVMASGAAGFAVGRNVWQSKNPVQMADEVAKIVFNA
jgi:class I fructose-bisphosphate aldolase